MSKKLKEAWITICRYNNEIIHDICGEYVENPLEEEIDIVNKALQRLEAIDNANPNEALEQLNFLILDCVSTPFQLEAAKIVEQALIQAEMNKENLWNYHNIALPFINEVGEILDIKDIDEMLDKIKEQEKVLKIVFEKKVNILLLELAENVDEYNERIVPNGKLTKEEFDILKGALDNE